MAKPAEIKQLRQKVAGAKSYLSRLCNEAHNEARRTGGSVERRNDLVDKANAQREVFRALIMELRRAEGRTNERMS